MVSDPIADMLTRIRNGLKARFPKVDVPASKLKLEIARILKDEGYILNYKIVDEGSHKAIRVYLKYSETGQPAITSLERVSKPGCRVYVGSREIPKVLGGLGISILTTPKGVMTGKEARKQNVGGELLCRVY
ncbi:MAG: 30S ribosomal protein S8 [Bryobacteraceae bacterium]|nr:30S ribosomal protein S8 [Bryobacteraceae bacterium]MCX7603000.1 30S ribosomal protein S8 [Bryobacteraceae bacterium]